MNSVQETTLASAGEATGDLPEAGDVDEDAASGTASRGGVRPVMIGQLLGASRPNSDTDFKIDGEVVRFVTIVGQIGSISRQTTHVVYTLGDGTDVIEVKEWNDVESSSPQSAKLKLKERGYCRVWGVLKENSFNHDRKMVEVYVIRPITDINEVNYHRLEARAAQLYFKYGPDPWRTTRSVGETDMTQDG